MPEVDAAIVTWLSKGFGVPIMPTSLYGQSGSKFGWYVDYVSSLLSDPWSAEYIVDAVATSHNIPPDVLDKVEYVYNLIVHRSMKMRDIDMRKTINQKKLSKYHINKANVRAKVCMKLEVGKDGYSYPSEREKPRARRSSTYGN